MLVSRAQRLGAIVAGAALYFAAAKLGFALAFVEGTVSAVWPPTGVALVMVVLWGPRMLPAILLGETASCLVNGNPLWMSALFATGNAVEALAGRELLRRAGFRPQLDRVRDVFALFGLAALTSTLISATVATAGFALDGLPAASYWDVWHVWWLGNATGVLVVAPLLFVLATTTFTRPTARRALEGAAFAVALTGIAILGTRSAVGAGYLVMPVLLWGALRFGMPGAAVANAALAGAGIVTAAAAGTEWARVEIAQRVLYTQNFVAVAALTTLVIAAVMSERERARRALEASEREATALAAEQAGLGRVASAVAYGAPAGEVFATVAEEAARLVGASHAAVERFEDAERVGEWGTPDATRGLEALIVVAGEIWGAITVSGADARPDARARLAHFAELTSVAVAHAEQAPSAGEWATAAGSPLSSR